MVGFLRVINCWTLEFRLSMFPKLPKNSWALLRMISWNLGSSPPIPSPSIFHCLQGPQHLGDPSGSHHPSWVAAPAPLWLHTRADRGAAHAWRRAAVREPRARPCCGTLEIWRAEVWMMKIYLVIWYDIYIYMFYFSRERLSAGFFQ